MGYYSQVALKTTTEGWILMKRLNESIEKEEDKPLAHMTVEKTKSGFYKISHNALKWYDGYSQVANFNLGLDRMREQDIPYTFIRIGEDIEDIETNNNWTDDMPDELQTFDVLREIYDDSEGCYETIMEKGKDVKYEDLFTPKPESKATTTPTPTTRDIDIKMKGIMFDLFDEYSNNRDMEEALRSLNSEGHVSDSEYNWALENWNKYLELWIAKEVK